MSRFLPAVLVALLLLAALAPSAGATEQWCEDDPLVIVRTPRGNLVPVYVNNGAKGLEHLPAVLAARIRYTAQPAIGGTLVSMDVTIPDDWFDDHFDTRTAVTTGPANTGTRLAAASGYSGEAMRVQFKLKVR